MNTIKEEEKYGKEGEKEAKWKEGEIDEKPEEKKKMVKEVGKKN